MSRMGVAVMTTSMPQWRRPVVERYADGSNAWLARLGRVILKVDWARR